MLVAHIDIPYKEHISSLVQVAWNEMTFNLGVAQKITSAGSGFKTLGVLTTHQTHYIRDSGNGAKREVVFKSPQMMPIAAKVENHVLKFLAAGLFCKNKTSLR